MHIADDIYNKALEIVLVNLLKVIVINLAFNVLIALGSSIFLKIFFNSNT